MRIVHCISTFNTGGAEAMLVDIANEQVKTDDVTVIILDASYQQYLIDQFDRKIKVIKMNRKPMGKSPFPILMFNILLLRLRPDVIHVHTNVLMKFIVIPFRKIFYTAHALNVPLTYVHRRIRIIAISDAVKGDILNRKNCVVHTIANGIVTEKIQKKNISDYNIKNTFRIVQVGRLAASIKGQDILIEAIKILREYSYDNITVDFIGIGESEDELKKSACNYNLEKSINFIGLQTREEIYSHLKDYDLMCHPARHEGFGLVIPEAMSAGLPVLVSNEGGPNEIIRGEKYGYSFISGDARDCANKIKYIMTNYSEAVDKARNAIRYSESEYSIKNTVAKYRQYYLS